MIICTAKLLGQSLASLWTAPTTPLPNNLHPWVRRGNIAEAVSSRALAGSHMLWGREALPAARQAALHMLAMVPSTVLAPAVH